MALQALAVGAAITGTLLNAYSQVSGYKEQKATTKYNQAIIDANNRIDSSLIDMDIRRIQREGEELIGAQRAAVGKSGTKFSGSNIDVFMDTMKDIQLDIETLNIKKMVGGIRAKQEKSLQAQQLASGKRAAGFGVTSSLLKGATGLLSMAGTGTSKSPNTGTTIRTSAGSGIRTSIGD